MHSIKTQGRLTRDRGISERVRNLWALSLSQCAVVNNAMIKLTGLTAKTSEQHVDVSEARHKRYIEDFNKFREWLKERNPLTFNDGNFHSLHAGWTFISRRGQVNCDKAEDLEILIHEKPHCNDLSAAKIASDHWNH